MTPHDVQRLVLRNPRTRSVAHLILTVPEHAGEWDGQAWKLLRAIAPSFGLPSEQEYCLSIGFSFAGLEALCMPEGYLRVIRRRAPAFADGAVLRSPRLGDSGPSAAPQWRDEFQRQRAHVLLSWHGTSEVCAMAEAFALRWQHALQGESSNPLGALTALRTGQRLGAPPGQDADGEWVHYGYRDGISELCIDDESPQPAAPDLRRCKPGELLLDEVNGAGFNSFALARAPALVRNFFHDSTFGIFRPMAQKLGAFEQQVREWKDQLSAAYDHEVSNEFVKAKLCGRWPDGRQLLPGDLKQPTGTLQLNLAQDAEGQGCPFGSHVRRMRAPPDREGLVFDRPLQRRSVPFGLPDWEGKSEDKKEEHGLLGHFFCASIENQFEHLLGQWAARAPLGFSAQDRAPDPVIGTHSDRSATLVVPWKGRLSQRLKGFQSWTRTQGTMYAWYPGREGWRALCKYEFEPDKNRAPWL